MYDIVHIPGVFSILISALQPPSPLPPQGLPAGILTLPCVTFFEISLQAYMILITLRFACPQTQYHMDKTELPQTWAVARLRPQQQQLWVPNQLKLKSTFPDGWVGHLSFNKVNPLYPDPAAGRFWPIPRFLRSSILLLRYKVIWSGSKAALSKGWPWPYYIASILILLPLPLKC